MTAQRPKSKSARRGRIAKWLGIAGLLGVAASGALIVRDERQRRAYTPDQVRDRLRERAARATERDPEA